MADSTSFKAGPPPGPDLSGVKSFNDTLLESIQDIQEWTRQLAMLAPKQNELSAMTAKATGSQAELGQASTRLSKTIDQAGNSFALQSVAVLGAISIVERAVGFLKSTIESYSPSTVELFDQAVRNVSAVLGMALTPILQGLTDGLQAVTTALYPVVDELMPVFRQLGAALAPLLAAIGQLVGSLLHIFAPVIEHVVKGFAFLGDVLTLIVAAIRTFDEMLYASLGAGLKEIVAVTVQQMKMLALTIASVVGLLTRLFLGAAGINRLIANLDEARNRRNTQVAAPQDAAIKSFEQYAKDLATAAFIVTGEATDDTNSLLTQIRDILRAHRDGPGIDDVLRGALPLIPGGDFLRAALALLPLT